MGYETTNKIIIRGKSEEIKSLGEKIKNWLSESEGKDDENWVGYIGNAAFAEDENYNWSDIGFISCIEITDEALIIDEDTKYGVELDLWYSLGNKYLTEYELDYVSIWDGDEIIDTNVTDFKGKLCITNLDTDETFGDYTIKDNHFRYCDYDESEVDFDTWDEEEIEYEILKYKNLGEDDETSEDEEDNTNMSIADKKDALKKLFNKLGATLDLENSSDKELISECFRRMYSDQSDIVAVKIWTLDDIREKAGEWCTKADAKEIVARLNIDALSDCTDSEWEAIDQAIKTYKKK
ncbi:MAG: hypothetical protein MJ188_11455 [Treponema sp.]|nr:hypothetical protein [Treponema sp.]